MKFDRNRIRTDINEDITDRGRLVIDLKRSVQISAVNIVVDIAGIQVAVRFREDHIHFIGPILIERQQAQLLDFKKGIRLKLAIAKDRPPIT